ncbi:hypothetical protein OROGR_019191 [Orobanche gracilis]
MKRSKIIFGNRGKNLKFCGERGSNTRPSDLQSDALPTELSPRFDNRRLPQQILFLRWAAVSCDRKKEESKMGKAKIQSFKDEFSFEVRRQESQNIIAKYPDRVPGLVVAERYTKSDLPQMEKKKFLVPRDMSVGQFIHTLGGRLHLAPGKALFVFVKNTLPQTYF